MSPLGSHYCMPLLVLNMGGEMIYILNQRLQAQNIPPEKARKVLGDVVRTMYTPVFLDELFKPQEIYTVASTKQIFDKLAHSSIMRLNKTSMDKLFDLMTMGVKHQLLSCKCPQQFLQVTLNHLDTLIEMVQSDGVAELVQVAIGRCIETYSTLSNGNWLLLEETLMQFFQGKRIKVSLFLQRNLQTMSGALVLNNCGVLPCGTDLPGDVRYFEGKDLARLESFYSRIRDLCITSDEVLESNWMVGTNIYQRDAEAKAAVSGSSSSVGRAEKANSPALLSSSTEAAKAFARAPASPSTAMPKSPVRMSSRGASSKSASGASAKAELTVLSDLLGVSRSGGAGEKAQDKSRGGDKLFRINLFPNAEFQAKDGGEDAKGAYEGGGATGFIAVDIDGAAGAKTISTYEELLDWKDDDFEADAKSGGGGNNNDGDDDLLALMDSAK